MGTPLNKLKPHRGTTPSLPDSSHVGIHQLIVLDVRIPNSKYIHFNRSDMWHMPSKSFLQPPSACTVFLFLIHTSGWFNKVLKQVGQSSYWDGKTAWCCVWRLLRCSCGQPRKMCSSSRTVCQSHLSQILSLFGLLFLSWYILWTSKLWPERRDRTLPIKKRESTNPICHN